MNTLLKNSVRVFKIIILTLVIASTASFAQEEKKQDIKKKYAEFVGDWKFDIEGMGEIMITMYFEQGTLWGLPETTSEPGELEPVKGKKLEFICNAPDGNLWQVKFMKDDKGKITKCHIIVEDLGLDTIGNKIVKEAEKKEEKIDKTKLYKEIAGDYEFDIEGMLVKVV